MTDTRKRLFDSPTDLVLLRTLTRAPRLWHDSKRLRAAFDWACHKDVYLGSTAYRSLQEMEEAGLLESKKAPGSGLGRLWRIRPGASVLQHTGGIDPSRIDREEIRYPRKRVSFEPQRYLAAKSTQESIARAIEQCPSPWAYGERMAKIK